MSIKGGTGGAGGGGRISTSGEAGGSTTGGCDSAGAGSVLVGMGLGALPREILLTATELQARPLYLKIAPWILLVCY